MRLPGLTIGRGMALVGVVAANLAVGRALSLWGSPELMLGSALPAIGLEVAAWWAWRGRGRGDGRRWAFALGFLLAGGVVLGSLIGAMLRPACTGIGPTGVLVTSPGSLAWRGWAVYFDRVERLVEPIVPVLTGSMPAQLAFVAVFLGAPPLLAGLIGGLMGVLVWRAAVTARTDRMPLIGEARGDTTETGADT